MKRSILCVVLLAFALAAHAQMRPGRWEMTTEMKMQGMQMPAQKWGYCLSAKDIAEGKQHRMDDGKSKCEMSELKTSGSSYTYRFNCSSPEGKMSGEAKGSSTADAFKTDIKLRMTPDPGVGEFSQVMTGRRAGDC